MPITGHRFYAHQPDLNFDNPQVLEAVLGSCASAELGRRAPARCRALSRGARGHQQREPAKTHDVLKRIRAEIDNVVPRRMLLAEPINGGGHQGIFRPRR